jgi:hypothetical protein
MFKYVKKTNKYYLHFFFFFVVCFVSWYGVSTSHKEGFTFEGGNQGSYVGHDSDDTPWNDHRNDHAYTNPANVNLPLNTSESCTNFCGPPNRCSITGESCLSDNNCQGCQPPITRRFFNSHNDPAGLNDAGKLLTMIPAYSVLTTDIGTRAYTFDKGAKPVMGNFGTNLWRCPFDVGLGLYKKRYNPTHKDEPFLLTYPSRPSLTGDFCDDGPFPANTPLQETQG